METVTWAMQRVSFADTVNYPNSGKGAVVMINRGNYGHGLQDEILRSIAKEYEWPDYLHEKA